MTKRKTVKVDELVEMANNYLLNSEDKLAGERLGIASFIEGVLFRANRYAGFGYLSEGEMKRSFSGKTPGVVWVSAANVTVDGEGMEPIFRDQSRRHYYSS